MLNPVTGAAPFPESTFEKSKDLYWKYLAETGGVYGRNVEVVFRDDEFDPTKALQACRDVVDGRDDMGMSRQRAEGAPIKLIVYPGASHAFDAPNLRTPTNLSGHHLDFNQSATDQSIAALHEFLDATIGPKIEEK